MAGGARTGWDGDAGRRGSAPSRGSFRLRDCADCAAFGRGSLRGNCSHACNGTALRVLPPPAPPGAALCRERTPDGRLLVFLVGRGDGDEDEEGGDVAITVWAEEGECVEPPPRSDPIRGTPNRKAPRGRGSQHPKGPLGPRGWVEGLPAPK